MWCLCGFCVVFVSFVQYLSEDAAERFRKCFSLVVVSSNSHKYSKVRVQRDLRGRIRATRVANVVLSCFRTVCESEEPDWQRFSEI